MVTWTDSFERADGPMGNGWSVDDSKMSLYGGAAYNQAATQGSAMRQLPPNNADNRISAVILPGWTSSVTNWLFLYARINETWNTYYYARLTFRAAAGGMQWQLWRVVAGTPTAIGSGAVDAAAQGYTCDLEVTGSDVRLYRDGAEIGYVSDATIASGNGVGFGVGTSGRMLAGSVTATYTNAAEPTGAISVEPSFALGLGLPGWFYVFGTATDWPVLGDVTTLLTLSTGTLQGGTVLLPGLIAMQVLLPNTAATITVTDIGTGATDTIDVLGSANIGDDTAKILAAIQGLASQMKAMLGGSGGVPITIPDLSALLESVGELGEGITLQARTTDIWGKVAAIWPIATDPDANLGNLFAILTSMQGVVEQTDTNVLSLVQSHELGIPAVLDAIAALPPADVTAVINLLNTIRGDETTTLSGIAAQVSSVATSLGSDTINAHQKLDDLHAHILDTHGDVATIHNVDLPAIKTVADSANQAAKYALTMSLLPLLTDPAESSIDLVSIVGDVASLIGDALTIADLANIVWGTPAAKKPATLEAMAVKLQTIENELLAHAAQRIYIQPFPGIANVTQGAPQAFDGPCRITAVMDGAILAVSTLPVGVQVFGSGAGHRWYRIGWYAFEDAEGNIEQPRWLTDTSVVLVPDGILHPAALVLACSTGVAGTVTPWVSNL